MSRRRSPEQIDSNQNSFVDSKGRLNDEYVNPSYKNEYIPSQDQINILKFENDKKIRELYDGLGGFNGVIHDESTDYEIQELNDRTKDRLDDGFSSDEKELAQEVLSNAETKYFGETAVKNAKIDLYSRDISSLKQKDVVRMAEHQLDLSRHRTSYEAKQDVLVALAAVFNHYSNIGSNMGMRDAISRGKLEGNYNDEIRVPKSFFVAEDYLINFLASVQRNTKEDVYKNPNTNKFRRIPDIITNALKLKDVTWFEDAYVPISTTIEQKHRFERQMRDLFATKIEYNPVTGEGIKSSANIRNGYLKNLSELLKTERSEYRKSKNKSKNLD